MSFRLRTYFLSLTNQRCGQNSDASNSGKLFKNEAIRIREKFTEIEIWTTREKKFWRVDSKKFEAKSLDSRCLINFMNILCRIIFYPNRTPLEDFNPVRIFYFSFFDLKFFLGILQDNKIFFGDWTFFKGSLGRVMALQRPRLVLALKNREKYLKTCKVAQNFSFFWNFQKKLEKKIFGQKWPFLAIFIISGQFLAIFGKILRFRQK